MLKQKFSDAEPLVNTLLQQNKQLKSKLYYSNHIIKQLKQQIEKLRQKLELYEKTKQRVQIKNEQILELEEIFSNDSDDQIVQDQYEYTDVPTESQCSMISHRSTLKILPASTPLLKHSISLESQSPLKLKNGLFTETKSPNFKILRKNTFDKQLQEENPNFNNYFMSVKQVLTDNTQKGESMESERSLFKKCSTSKAIFSSFLVTGMSKDKPIINYYYPKPTQYFETLLSLFYSQNSIQQNDVSPSKSFKKLSSPSKVKDRSKSLPNQNVNIKDTFIIPLNKLGENANSFEKEYVIACEVQDQILDKEFSGMFFPRFYCFITTWKFFEEFKKLISQFLDRILIKKKQIKHLTEQKLNQLIKKEIQQPLEFLYKKSADENKTINYCLDETNIRFSVDIPPVENQYQLILQYKRWNILNTKVQLKMEDEDHLHSETHLYGILIIYILAEVKIILYSTVKSKISQAIFHAIEVIKPLSYVNPIMIAAIKEQLYELMNAPMSIILGLWSQQKKSNRQKIQIFMNKKMNLLGLIQKAKLEMPDVVVFNLDTGLVFGSGLKANLNHLGMRLNLYRQKYCNNKMKEYKLLDRILNGKMDEKLKEIWLDLYQVIKKTMLYSYYQQSHSFS